MKYLVMVQGTQADYEAMRGKASANSPAAFAAGTTSGYVLLSLSPT